MWLVERLGQTAVVIRSVPVVVMLLILGFSSARPSDASCGAVAEPSYPGAMNFQAIGDTVRVRVTLGARSISGGTQLTIWRFRFNLDCNNAILGVACPDDGPVVSYQGNITTDCGVAWNASTAAGATLPNQVVFTPDKQIIVPANTFPFCQVEFDVRVESRSNDGTPDAIEETFGYDAGGFDATCNTLPPSGASPSVTGAMVLCPLCDDGNPCNGQEFCDRTTGCASGPPVVCDDNSVCSDDACDPGVSPSSDPCVYTDNSGRCNDNDVCTDDRCDPLAGCLHAPNPECNHPLDCSAALPSLGELWPPDLRMAPVTIEGVGDPGEHVSITITGITQDEAIGVIGRSCPDGAGVGTETAFLRADRISAGDGRLYTVSFMAQDGSGGQCTGAVTVCVPHDRGHPTCGRGAASVDSTGPCSVER